MRTLENILDKKSSIEMFKYKDIIYSFDKKDGCFELLVNMADF